jgi:sec-independent protein translocase protein TatA
MPNLGGWEIVILVVVVLLLFGAKKLPDMARSVGQSARIFKGEMKGMKGDDKSAKADTEVPPAQLPPASNATPSAPVEQPADRREQ